MLEKWAGEDEGIVSWETWATVKFNYVTFMYVWSKYLISLFSWS
jgi:hypothetical protein